MNPTETCKRDSDCKNDACGRVGSKGTFKYECCPSGETKVNWFSDYCVQPGGLPCDYDEQCDSDNCFNTCVPLKPRGAKCSRSVDCESKACGLWGRGDSSTANNKCCDSSLLTRAGYCVQPGGEPCDHDVQCYSGRCENYECYIKKNAGSVCKKDDDCLHDKCGRVGTDERLECCAGDMRTSWFKDYCIGEDGSPCSSDAQCSSRKCKNNACVITKQPGAKCADDYECASVVCQAGVCIDSRKQGELCDFDYQCKSSICDSGACSNHIPYLLPSTQTSPN